MVFINHHSKQCNHLKCNHCIFCKNQTDLKVRDICLPPFNLWITMEFYVCKNCRDFNLCIYSFSNTLWCQYRKSSLAESFYAYQMAIKRKTRKKMPKDLRIMLWKRLLLLKPCLC